MRSTTQSPSDQRRYHAARHLHPRTGSLIPLFAVCLVAICGFVAMAVDLGMVAVARTQCQNAADAAAVAGARSLDGTAGGNLSVATDNAILTATSNEILSQPISASQVSVRHGSYHYDPDQETFSPQFPPVAPDNYNLTEVTITYNALSIFSRVLSLNGFSVSTTATAAHRPRDVAIVLDYSGSMNNESDVWNNEGYLGAANNSPNNTDPIIPEFGPYSTAFSPAATLRCTSGDARVGKCNITQSVLGVPPLVNDFYQNSRGSGGVYAFSPAPATVTNTLAGGDQYQNAAAGATPARNWQEITGSAAIKFQGYATPQGGTFYGYQQGPGYWGKTFFLWPPDPNTTGGKPNDWRKRFFKLTGGSPLNDNRKLWDTAGKWRNPQGNYTINYAAILDWIKHTGPAVFPPTLRAGNVLYYDQIPDDVPASAYDHTQPNDAIADANQRFWKEYIDFTLGVWRDPIGAVQNPGKPSCSYGPDFTCGPGGGIQITGPDAAGPEGLVFIAPLDNPLRPRHRLWFGPLTMIQYLSDTGMLPGTSHDISMIPAKLGIAGALKDVENNHPNDMVTLILFSRPTFSGEAVEAGQFSNPQIGLGRNYSGMITALWYPPNSSSADVRPWDPNGLQTPRAHGDYIGNTATSYGLMLAYNQFSGSPVLKAAGVGGLGRKGAQKIVILETDGMANVATSAAVTNSGPYKSMYNIRPTDAVTAGGGSASQNALDVATRLCALETDSNGLPGYATPRKPVLIHTLAFGAVFEPSASGAEPANAVAFLQQLSAIGGTVFPASASDPANGYKWCVGTLSERQEKLRQAFTKIMDANVSVVLVK